MGAIMKKRSYLFFGILLAFLFFPLSAHAETGNVQFSIQGVIPENQIDKTQTYFDLKLQPGEKQEIKVAIHNDATEATDFIVNVNQAYTNSKGLIDYNSQDVTPDKSMQYQIKDIVTKPEKVSVPANSSKEFAIQITMPKEKFDGRIMAGIQVLKVVTVDGKEQPSQFGYVLGLQLRNILSEVKREVKIADPKAAISFGKTAFSVNIQNPTMDAIGKMTYTGKITAAGKTETLQKIEWENRSMAPNSNFDLAFDMNDQEIKPGKYELHLKISDGKSNVWQFKEPFTVSSERAKEVNSAIIPMGGKSQTPSWLYWLIGALGALLALLMVRLIKSQRSQNKEITKELNV